MGALLVEFGFDAQHLLLACGALPPLLVLWLALRRAGRGRRSPGCRRSMISFPGGVYIYVSTNFIINQK